MTDKARELLEQALEAFSSSLYGEFELKNEIRTFLEQPEVKREKLSDDEIIEAYKSTPVKGTLAYFIAGVRLAESKYNEEKQ